MATVSATTPVSIVARTVVNKLAVSSLPVGLPPLRVKSGLVRCSLNDAKQTAPVSINGAGASLLAAVSAATMSSPAMALVDERMSTEGTGLSLGISNNLLGWIIVAVFGLIWSLYIVYTGTLEEDEESGLSL